METSECDLVPVYDDEDAEASYWCCTCEQYVDEPCEE